MLYRTLGRTGLQVSQLGFGAMRLPMIGEAEQARVDDERAIPMLHRAMAAGVNYFDTAINYCNRDSQRALGTAIKAWGKRDQLVISTKNHDYGSDEKSWWTNLENSLRLLQVERIDIYNNHGMNAKCWRENVEPRISKWMLKAKDQGLIQHICCSFHDDNAGLRTLIDTGFYSSITLQYNMLDRALADGIAYAAAKNIGVVVMGPVGGGRLGATSQVLQSLVPGINRVPELAMRFVLSNPAVCVALSGMSMMQQVEENLATCSDATTLSESDQRAIHDHLDKLKNMADLYCTGCKYCLPCPQNVDIPTIFAHYNVGRVYGLWDVARDKYQRLMDKGVVVDACADCGECEGKCPQHLEIREQLRKAHEQLARAK